MVFEGPFTTLDELEIWEHWKYWKVKILKFKIWHAKYGELKSWLAINVENSRFGLPNIKTSRFGKFGISINWENLPNIENSIFGSWNSNMKIYDLGMVNDTCETLWEGTNYCLFLFEPETFLTFWQLVFTSALGISMTNIRRCSNVLVIITFCWKNSQQKALVCVCMA